METMHPAGRRNLPPVPRPALDAPEVPGGLPEESPAEQTMELRRRLPDEAPAQALFPSAAGGAVHDHRDDDMDGDMDGDMDTADDDTAVFGPPLLISDADVDPEVLAAADEPEHALEDDDPAQGFVSRLRASATDFAAAAGAQTAVVREAVPPARHRRSRCRVVLRYADGAEADLTFLGSVGRPGTPAWQGFDAQIQSWLGTGQQRQSAWLVEDTEAPDGVAVDVPAWLAAG